MSLFELYFKFHIPNLFFALYLVVSAGNRPENQCFKHTFNVFDQFLVDLEQLFNFPKNPRWPP